MAKKFLTDINIAAGVYDSSGDIGNSGQVLSSTGSGVNWINATSSASVVYQDGFTGDGSTTAFTLANSIDNENKTQVYIDGVYQHKDTFSLSGTTLTFSTAPPSTTDIEVISFSSVSAADDILYDDDFSSAGLMTTNGSGVYSITTNNSSNWNTAYTYSQVGHLPLAGGAITGAITTNSTFDGRDVSVDGTKLDGIETSATADQTDAEIRTAVEAATDSNVFTDADHTKLNAIEASATADQTAAEIRVLVEAATDSNVFTDADHTKLNAIEASADVTDTTNVTAAGALMDSELTDLAGIKAVTISDLATETYVDTAVSDLVDSSPATLNTLNELAAALGDDPNFATTTATSIGTKLPLAGGTLTGALIGTSFNDGYITWSSAQINRYGAAIELQYTPTNTSTLVKIGANGSNPTIFNAYTGDASFAGHVSAAQFRPTNIVTNKVVKFNGTQLDDSIITDDGSTVTVAGNITGTNLSGTNTGDQTLPTASSLGAVTLTGNQSIGGIKTFTGTNITLDTAVNNWKYVRLQSAGTVKWDIATNESDDSSSLQFRPAGGGTNRVTISQAGVITAPRASINAGAGYPLQTSSSQRYGIQIRNTNNTVNTNYGWWWGTDTNFDMFFHADGASDRFTLTRQGEATAFASMSAPIYYDRNDTSYYLNPASTGTSLNIAGGISTNVANGNVIIKHTVSEANSWLFQENAANWGLFWLNEGANGTAFGSYTTVGAEFIGFRNGSNTNFKNPSAWTGIASGAYAGWLLSNYSGYFWTASTQYSETDMRAPVFYDSANTSYYLDPASTSILNRVEINDDLDVRSQVGTWITSDVMGDAIGWNSSYGVYIGSNVGGTHYLRGNGTFTTGGSTHNLWHEGNDSGLLVKGTAIFANAVADDTSGPLNFNRSSGWDEYIIKHGTSKGMFGKKGIGWHMDSANSFHILSSGWTANFGVEHGGSCRAAGDLRAPIFYDIGNTGFYINADSTSNLYNLELSGAKHTYLYITPGNGYEAMVRFNGGSGNSWYAGKRTSTQLLGSTDAFHFYSQTSSQTVGGYDTSGNHYAVGSSRAPIFYDQNDTTYYYDPNVGAVQKRTLNVVGSSGSYGSQVIAGQSSIALPYSLQDSNARPVLAATGAYPVLHLNHTVTSNTNHGPTIQFTHNGNAGRQWVIGSSGDGEHLFIGFSNTSQGNSNYNPHNGIAGYNGTSPMTFHENGRVGIGGDWGGLGSGDPGYAIDTRGTLYNNTDVRAPIFYDTNNTGYYVNPNATSKLAGLEFNFTQHGSANNIKMGNSTTMNAISSGSNNAAFGVEALGNCSSGSRNFAYGYAALFSVTSGGNNIAMGDACGYNVSSGSNNLLFGQNAGRTGYQSPQSIGGVSTASNQIHMGNESHSTARIQISWTVNSDSRDKTDVTPINVGLDFVKDLNPVTFRWDKRSDYEDRTPTGENKLEELTLGFLAQEVEAVEKSYGYDVANKTNLVVDRDVENDGFGLTYEKMIPILTKAIQELEARVQELENN